MLIELLHDICYKDLMKNKHRRLIVSFSIYMLLTTILFPQEVHKSNILQTAQQLRSFLVEPGDANLPDNAVNLQTQFKHLLRDMFIEVMKKNPDAESTELKQLFESALKSKGIKYETSDIGYDSKAKFSIYGFVFPITIDKQKSHPQLLAVTIPVSVMCGKDTSLYLFERQNEQYQHILSYEAPTYKTIDKAHSLFQYQISPKDRNGKYFIVAANVNPWCSSNWQELHYVVLRPGRSPDKPKILLKGKDIIYIGANEPIYSLAVTYSGFSLDFTGEDPDPEIIMKHHHIKHTIHNNTIY
ncbi:MAG: hypothetical protein A2Y62_20490 [Candidatus Fischerbacteria bacterium RBG_13_37_8]|uniref:Uncharacterized protein n=1 Tax=Candidatus Fischerbacteria bacterium RBG_13_37_8 TaxID=1817863 RepID=A0A1F5VYA1_9BACT|nr:MAG: hypothetical protein A2Y62_20490 [Candidatus Fischerbacteria bacterium RBG_13_37_8]